MLDRLKTVFASVFGDHIRDEIEPGATMESVESWDSMSFVQIMLAIETEFGVSVGPDDALELTSVNGILGLLEARKAQ